MAQVKYQGNLSAASFPFSTTFKGPAVIVPNRDQSSGPYRDFSGSTTQLGMNIAQIYYAENVIPTNEGFKSIAYNPFIGAAVGYTGTFQEEFTVFDGNSNKALVARTSTREIWVLSQYTAGAWTKIILPSAAVWSSGILTTANVYGVIYFNLQGLGIYIYDIPTSAFTKATVTGITDSDLIGITDSSSYLVGFDEISVVWSSTENPLDFVPSLITGAGGGTPDQLKGQIIYCKEISKGYIIYTSVGILAATYSGNLQYPWVFLPLANGSGISGPDDVITDLDVSSQWAWTAAGLLEVTTQYCTVKFPEVTDFLAGGIWEEFSTETKTVTTTYTDIPFRVKLAFVGNRYFAISYGQRTAEAGDDSPLTYVLLYDSILKRWGKAKKTHTQIFEITADTSGYALTWTGSAPNEWEDYPVAWSSLTNFSNSAAHAKNTFGFIGTDGAVDYVDFNYGTGYATGVAIFGKYQLTRTSLCTVEEVEIETTPSADIAFTLSIQSTDNGRDVISPVTSPYLNPTQSSDSYRRYDCRVTGVNHSLVMEGSFALNSYVLTLHQNGRR